MQVGHTRCLVDGHFGQMNKIYHHAVWYTDTLSEMASCSLIYCYQYCTVIRLAMVWLGCFIPMFSKKIVHITKYQHFQFRFSSRYSLHLQMLDFQRKGCMGVICTNLKRACSILSEERKKYLYEEIHPFITPRCYTPCSIHRLDFKTLWTS